MMKKLLIGASALALTTGVANAQAYFGKKDSFSVASQSTTTIPNAGTSNNSSVTQNEDDNLANIDQTQGAKNTSIVTQGVTGSAGSGDNRADVTQKATTTGLNYAKVTQIGTDRDNSSFEFGAYPGPSASDLGGKDQRVVITQNNTLNSSNANNRNTAVVTQGSTNAGGLRNYAKVDQTGAGNAAGITQGALAAGFSIEEDGRMQATITQNGRNNTAETAQGEMDKSTTNQTGNSNQAYVSQDPTISSGNAGLDNYGRVSTVDQTGDNNETYVIQNGLRANSDVDQDGDRNLATVTQTGDDTVSKVDQDGDYHDADVVQNAKQARSSVIQDGPANGLWGGHDAVVRQNVGADRAVSEITQKGSSSAFLGGGGSKAYVTQNAGATDVLSQVFQTGVGHIATVTQSGMGDTLAGAKPESYIEQVGNGNIATLNQAGDLADSSIRQGFIRSGSTFSPTTSSLLNVATVTQTSAADNASSDIAQSGRANGAVVTQSAADTKSKVDQIGNLNLTTVKQSGAGAQSTVYQKGNLNLSLVDQRGAGDISEISQTGDLNSADVLQTGLAADSKVTQLGDSNTATIRQAANNVRSIVGQTGDDNVATILQNTVAASFSVVSQNGNGNVANVSQ